MKTTIILLFVMNILDVSNFNLLVRNNGGVELNPIALWTMQYGNLGFILFKLRFLIGGRINIIT